MLHWTPSLNRYDKVRFLQTERFLASRGTNPGAVWVGPEQASAAAPAAASSVVTYDGSKFDDGNPAALSRFRIASQIVEVRSSLPTALGLLQFVFDDPAHLRRLSSLNPTSSPTDGLHELGIDPHDVLTPSIGAYAAGEYLAPTSAGWSLYLVEDYGEVVPIAYASSPVPLAYLLFSLREAQRSDLAQRVAAFLPADAGAIIRGEDDRPS